MTIGSHLRSIWRHRTSIAGLTVIVTVAVYLLCSLALTKVYQASAELSVTVPANSSGQTVEQTTVLFAANTFAQLGGTTPVLAEAAKRSGLGINRLEAASRTSVTASQTVGIIMVSAKGASTAEARTLDDALTESLIATVTAQQQAALRTQVQPIVAQITALKATVAKLRDNSSLLAADQSEVQTLSQELAQAQLVPNPQLAIVSPAVASNSPVSPKTDTYVLLAFITALILISELSAFWSYLNDSFMIDAIEQDVQRTLGLPVLAIVPTGRGPKTRDAFRALRTNLIFLGPDSPRRLAIVGVERKVGRTYCAIQIGLAVTEMNASAGLIDADLRQRDVATRLGLQQSPGLSDALEFGHSPRLQETPGTSKMSVLTAGTSVEDPAGLIGSKIVESAFPAFSRCEITVVDTPAAETCGDVLAIAPLCTSTLLVIDGRLSKRRPAKRLLLQLQQVGANPVGVIVNRADSTGWLGSLRRRPTAAKAQRSTREDNRPPSSNGNTRPSPAKVAQTKS
jgi:Mrp family chromosome partitioning ATPase